MLSSVCFMMIAQVGIGIYLFARSFYNPADTLASLVAAYGAIDLPGYRAAVGLYCSIIVLAIYPLAELWALHAVLIAKNMTTFEFIMANKDGLTAQPSSHSLRGLLRQASQRFAWCRSTRVVDEQASLSRAVSKRKVPLNPCLALRTQYSTAAVAAKPAAAHHPRHLAVTVTGVGSTSFDVAVAPGTPSPKATPAATPQVVVDVRTYMDEYGSNLMYGNIGAAGVGQTSQQPPSAAPASQQPAATQSDASGTQQPPAQQPPAQQPPARMHPTHSSVRSSVRFRDQPDEEEV
eukprot:jgi/Chrzof1/12034/Cz06g18250.t1